MYLKKKKNTYNHARRYPGAVCVKAEFNSDVCLTQCQRSDQQLLPPYTQRADHTAHGNATKPLAVVMATGPLQPITTPPLLSPLATAAALERRERARHPVFCIVQCFFFLFVFFSLSSSAHSVQWEENVFLEPFKPGSLESINGLICLLLKSESKAAGRVPRYSGQAAQTPRGGEKGCVTAPCLMTIVDLQLGPS